MHDVDLIDGAKGDATKNVISVKEERERVFTIPSKSWSSIHSIIQVLYMALRCHDDDTHDI
jgi:hypothetical protein